ncbi:Crp/Fnr family transcriptional regulator [Piscinibacter aquaticus]|uniref:Crp/Fnr family transcriptional regulator n=1 Tax=Piscinibacter aquaticus TaxID=392597 RepID=A0A5C6TZJ3_9BURK|nr:Crp/Fnr family transcriptional regulator [Piscinibacter aquaticus]
MTLQCQTLLEMLAGDSLPEWERFARDVRVRRGGRRIAVPCGPGLALAGGGDVRRRQAGLSARGRRRAHQVLHRRRRFFASLAALTPRGRTTFAAVAMTDLVVEQIPYVTLREFGDRHLARQRALRVGMERYGARKEKRERELLTLTPEQRYGRFLVEEAVLAARIPQKDLALYLGITPVALSRIRGRLQRSRT